MQEVARTRCSLRSRAGLEFVCKLVAGVRVRVRVAYARLNPRRVIAFSIANVRMVRRIPQLGITKNVYAMVTRRAI